jgi:hypothetical protein
VFVLRWKIYAMRAPAISCLSELLPGAPYPSRFPFSSRVNIYYELSQSIFPKILDDSRRSRFLTVAVPKALMLLLNRARQQAVLLYFCQNR